MPGVQISRDGKWFVVKLSAEDFASFAYELLKKAEASEDNGEPKRRGRPVKEPAQPELQGE